MRRSLFNTCCGTLFIATVALTACVNESGHSRGAPPTESSPCFEVQDRIVDFGTVPLSSVAEPIEIHVESRCPELALVIDLDDPDGQFDLSTPRRIGNQWYFDIELNQQTVGRFEAQVAVSDIAEIHRGRIQVFVEVLEDTN